MTLVRTFLLVLSTVGLWEILRRRSSAHISFLPSLTAAAQTCILLLGGILGRLPETAWLLFLLGLAAGGYYTVREKGSNLKSYFRWEYLFLALSLLFLFFCVQGRVFTHYDNFSHWAQVLKKILGANRFPDRNLSVLFEDYPLGSTVFVYNAVLLSGAGGEPAQMLAQGYLMLTCLMPLFQWSRKNSWPVFLLMAAAFNFLLSYNIPVTELLVDTLLPLAGMCALLFVYSRRLQTREAAPAAAVYLIWVLQIKNSGLFFALPAGLLFLYYARKNRRTVWGAGVLAAGLFSLLIWAVHCRLAFPPEAGASPFPGWAAALRDKSPEDIRHIVAGVFRFSLQWRDLGLFLLLMGFMGVCCVFVCRKYRPLFGKAALLMLFLYAAYQAGLLGMYIFSMPRIHAFHLSSIDRYEKSVLIAMYYLLTALAVRVFSEEMKAGSFPRFAALAMSISFCLVLWRTDSPWSPADYRPYRIGIYDGLEVRTWLETVKKENRLAEDGDYAIVISDWDSDYFWCLGMYLLPDSDIAVLGDPTEQDLDAVTARQILIHDPDLPSVRAWIHSHYPGQEGRAVITR
ncbi:MAG: hypothetical protein J6J41_08630 [Clostridia bacterium]|nr:hypothetical protein [Clostridia bacterium]